MYYYFREVEFVGFLMNPKKLSLIKGNKLFYFHVWSVVYP